MVLNNAVMHHHDMFRDMRVSVAFRRFTVRRPTGMGNTGSAMQRMLFRCLREHLDFTETTQAGHMPFTVDYCQTGRVIATVFETT